MCGGWGPNHDSAIADGNTQPVWIWGKGGRRNFTGSPTTVRPLLEAASAVGRLCGSSTERGFVAGSASCAMSGAAPEAGGVGAL